MNTERTSPSVRCGVILYSFFTNRWFFTFRRSNSIRKKDCWRQHRKINRKKVWKKYCFYQFGNNWSEYRRIRNEVNQSKRKDEKFHKKRILKVSKISLKNSISSWGTRTRKMVSKYRSFLYLYLYLWCNGPASQSFKLPYPWFRMRPAGSWKSCNGRSIYDRLRKPVPISDNSLAEKHLTHPWFTSRDIQTLAVPSGVVMIRCRRKKTVCSQCSPSLPATWKLQSYLPLVSFSSMLLQFLHPLNVVSRGASTTATLLNSLMTSQQTRYFGPIILY